MGVNLGIATIEFHGKASGGGGGGGGGSLATVQALTASSAPHGDVKDLSGWSESYNTDPTTFATVNGGLKVLVAGIYEISAICSWDTIASAQQRRMAITLNAGPINTAYQDVKVVQGYLTTFVTIPWQASVNDVFGVNVYNESSCNFRDASLLWAKKIG